MNKKYFNFYLLIILFLGGLFFYYMTTNQKSCESFYNDYIEKEYFGRITDKFYDKDNHNYRTIMYNHNEKLIFTIEKSGLFEFAKINDSISKNRGSNIVKIYRNNKAYDFKIDFGCDESDESN